MKKKTTQVVVDLVNRYKNIEMTDLSILVSSYCAISEGSARSTVNRLFSKNVLERTKNKNGLFTYKISKS